MDTTESSCSSSKEQNGNSSEENKDNDEGPKMDENSRFECNICLDVAKDAVVSMCGHLFCWGCLYQWLDTRPNRQTCPVCKSAISREKVIPIYGRGSENKDPREQKIPSRPRGQRTEESSQGFPGFQWGDGHGGVQFSLGIGVFPISFFASFFNAGLNVGGERPEPPLPGSRQHNEEQFLSNVFLYIGIIFIIWLLMV